MSTNATPPSDHVVGVLGLGAMGAPMARHLLAAGYPVYVHDLDPAAVDAAAALGAKAAGSPRALGENCDVVLVIVPTDEDTLEVCTGEEGILAHARPGTVLLMCSSVRPDTCEATAAAAPDGVEVLDAALTGGVRGAEEGVINLLVGGDEEALDRVRPALVLGLKVDPVVGPLLLVGVGGVLAEVTHDVVLDVPALDQGSAEALVRRLASAPLLEGYRGRDRLDVPAFAAMVVRLAEYSGQAVGELLELDFNPVLVLPEGQGAVAVDALAVLR